MSTGEILFQSLGQTGFLIECEKCKILVDPYLSDSVEHKEAADMVRQVPIAFDPGSLFDVDYVLITHVHRDHCDEETLVPLSKASPGCKFIGPQAACQKLLDIGISPHRIILAKGDIELNQFVVVHTTPSAHPIVKLATSGGWECVGYVLQVGGVKMYHPGDTALTSEIVEMGKQFGPVDVAMLPVNEINYMRNERGVIGNMSVREAFYLAEQIGVGKFMPTHWDMFLLNEVCREEIEIVYERNKPNFDLVLDKTLSLKVLF